MAYRYKSNRDGSDFSQLVISLDNGTSAILKRSFAYDLSVTELVRAGKYIVLELTTDPADDKPTVISKIPVVGDPNQDDLPFWNEELAAFVPRPESAGVSGSTDPEVVRDTMAAALVAGANVTITPSDAANTITIASTAAGTTDPEVVRDTIASALVAGANVTITPNDAANTITISASGGGTTDPEVVRDTIASALVAGPNVVITPNDADNTITISAVAGGTSGVTIPIGDDIVPASLEPYSGYTQFRAIAAVSQAQPGESLELTVIDAATGVTLATATDSPGAGRTAPDASASNRVAVVNGGVTLDVDGSGYVLDGTGYLSGSAIPLTTAFTFEARIKRSVGTALSASQFIWTQTNMQVSLDPEWGVITSVIDSGGASSFLSTVGGGLGLGKIENTSEHHIEFSWDGTTQRLFVDGVLGEAQSLASLASSATGSFTVGNRAFTDYFVGTVDNVAVHNVARHTAAFTPAATPTNNANTLMYLPATAFGYSDPIGRLVSDWTNIGGVSFLQIQVDNTTAAHGVIDNARIEVR